LTTLPLDFFRREDVTQVARDLLGKVLVTDFGGRCSARIVETEAYAGIADRASHAFSGRFTERTRVMYEEGGVAYVYLCYGIHHLFNVVTNGKGIPHAVLLRAAEPLEGRALMASRSGRSAHDPKLCSGPGRLSRALGITTGLTGLSLDGDRLLMMEDGFRLDADSVTATPRIGVGYAGEDAKLPYRFTLSGHPSVSGRRTENRAGS
jgi:DNA-3-methyladenine glycosylase